MGAGRRVTVVDTQSQYDQSVAPRTDTAPSGTCWSRNQAAVRHAWHTTGRYPIIRPRCTRNQAAMSPTNHTTDRYQPQGPEGTRTRPPCDPTIALRADIPRQPPHPQSSCHLTSQSHHAQIPSHPNRQLPEPEGTDTGQLCNRTVTPQEDTDNQPRPHPLHLPTMRHDNRTVGRYPAIKPDNRRYRTAMQPSNHTTGRYPTVQHNRTSPARSRA